MTPSEVTTHLFDNKQFADSLVGPSRRLDLVANCPLGCSDVRVFLTPSKALVWTTHRGNHPQSLRCFWSDKIIKDKVGEVSIQVTLKPIQV